MNKSNQIKDPELRQLISEERKLLSQKRAEFKERGKIFKANEHAGVVPQHIYDALRDRKDDKFRLPKGTGKTINRATLRKIADGDRVYPVNKFIIHHSVGPEFRDVNHSTIRKWYSDVGKSRAYAGIAHSGHYVEGYETFAQAQLAGHWHNGVWCIFDLMDDIWNVVAWGAGNWAVNQRAINIENCGRFNVPPDNKIVAALADWWRPQHRALGGQSAIHGHREVSLTGTACPELLGDRVPDIRVMVGQNPTPPAPAYNFVEEVGKARVQGTDGDQLAFNDAPRLSAGVKGWVPEGTVMDYVGYVTNGDNVDGSKKWWKNAYNSYFSERYAKKIEPAPPAPTPPAPTPTPPVAIKYEPLELPVEYIVKPTGAKLWNFNFAKHTEMQEVVAGSKKAGERVLIVGKAIHPTGSTYLMTGFSYNNSGKAAVPYKTTGYNAADMDVYAPAPPPIPNPPLPVPPTPEPPTPTPTDPDTNAIKAFLQALVKMIQEFLARFK